MFIEITRAPFCGYNIVGPKTNKIQYIVRTTMIWTLNVSLKNTRRCQLIELYDSWLDPSELNGRKSIDLFVFFFFSSNKAKNAMREREVGHGRLQ